MSTFGERLKEAREEKGISSWALAKVLGVGGSTTYNWENDISLPRNIETRRKIADALNVTETWLSTGTGEKSAEKREEQVMQVKAEQKFKTTTVYNRKDKRQLEDIELVIHHLRDMDISVDEMRAVHLTLSEIRTDLEGKVYFNGVSA